MLDSEKYNDNSLDKETQNQLFRVYVEKRFAEHSKTVADLHQDIYQLRQQISGWETVQTNINARLDAHGSDVAKIKNIEPIKTKWWWFR